MQTSKSNTKVTLLSFETLRSPPGVDSFLFCAGKSLPDLEADLFHEAGQPSAARLVVIDTLHPLLADASFSLPTFLARLASPATSILAVCHRDVPFAARDPYRPDPPTLLRYLATTLLTTHALPQVVAAKRARDRCVAEPRWGLAERVPGTLVGCCCAPPAAATVLEMEHRRRSGRAVRDWFVVQHGASAGQRDARGGGGAVVKAGGAAARGVVRLEEHPAYPRPEAEGGDGARPEGPETTFNLGLSEKERRDREGVRLPYFDAQNEGGIGEGGRILYDMGAEDDFDDEEDEI